MNIRNQYNEALNKLDVDVNDGLRDLINIYCVAIDSFENDIVDSIALYVIDMENKDTCRYLQEILSENKDPYLVKEFNVWIKEIKKTSSSRLANLLTPIIDAETSHGQRRQQIAVRNMSMMRQTCYWKSAADGRMPGKRTHRRLSASVTTDWDSC